MKHTIKHRALLSTSCLAIVITLGLVSMAQAETPSGIATSIGVVTGQPPIVPSANLPTPAIGSATIKPPTAIPVPEMPTMPNMPKMPVINNLGAPPAGTPSAPSSPLSDVMKHTHLTDAMNQDKILKNPNEQLSPAIKAFNEANSTMHQGMAVQFTGNTDVDFVKGMIPHHQGAVDMAKVVLQYGKDPEIKKFAEGIIKAQASEIDFMKKWLAAHPK